MIHERRINRALKHRLEGRTGILADIHRRSAHGTHEVITARRPLNLSGVRTTAEVEHSVPGAAAIAGSPDARGVDREVIEHGASTIAWYPKLARTKLESGNPPWPSPIAVHTPASPKPTISAGFVLVRPVTSLGCLSTRHPCDSPGWRAQTSRPERFRRHCPGQSTLRRSRSRQCRQIHS
jgi:hypothetical protein